MLSKFFVSAPIALALAIFCLSVVVVLLLLLLLVSARDCAKSRLKSILSNSPIRFSIKPAIVGCAEFRFRFAADIGRPLFPLRPLLVCDTTCSGFSLTGNDDCASDDGEKSRELMLSKTDTDPPCIDSGEFFDSTFSSRPAADAMDRMSTKWATMIISALVCDILLLLCVAPLQLQLVSLR